MSGLECCCLGSETFDRPDDGFSLLATSVGSSLPPSKYPNIGATLPFFALHASLLIPLPIDLIPSLRRALLLGMNDRELERWILLLFANRRKYSDTVSRAE